VRLEGLGQLKKIHFPACSKVPQPTTLSRAPKSILTLILIVRLLNSVSWGRGDARLVFKQCSVRISAMLSAILIEIFRDFSKFLQAKGGILHCFGYEHFLPNPFQFIIRHPLVWRYLISLLKALLNNRHKALDT
jgi:hypothetical protein